MRGYIYFDLQFQRAGVYHVKGGMVELMILGAESFHFMVKSEADPGTELWLSGACP